MKLRINSIIAFILMVSILAQPVFFSSMALLGISFEGSDSSLTYIIYIVALGIFSFSIYAYSILKTGILKNELYLLAIILIYISIHLLWVIFDPIYTELIQESLVFFLLFGLPGFLVAASIIKLDLINISMKIMEPIFIFISISIFSYALIPTLTGNRTTSLGGTSYQTLSYYSALSAGILFTYFTQIPTSLRIGIASSSIYKGLQLALVLCGLLGTLLGGGRGAFVLLVTYVLTLSYLSITNKNWLSSKQALIKSVVKVLTIILLFIVFIIYFRDKEFVQQGFKRATQFISPNGGIDIASGSSGRDIVYMSAIEYIAERPFLGYGPFGALEKTIQAHNIFLDILLQLGLIGLLISMLLLLSVTRRAIKNWSIHSIWVLALFLYPAIQLLFSFYYLHSSLFIFGITFYATYKKITHIKL